MTFEEYPDREFLAMRAADAVAGRLRSALGQKDRVSLAVPGGTTPGPVFDVLSGVDLDWDRIDVLPTDERWVAEGSDRSNARLIRRRLMVEKAAAARFHTLWRDTPRPEEALDEVTAAVAPLLPLDVLLIGMGDDMHCASIFPDAFGRDAALAADAPALLPIRRPDDPEARLTLTMPVLRDAMSTHVLITGADKRAALERAQKLTPAEAPISALLGDAVVHWAE